MRKKRKREERSVPAAGPVGSVGPCPSEDVGAGLMLFLLSMRCSTGVTAPNLIKTSSPSSVN